MNFRNLGQSNLKVSPIGLGGMPLSIDGRPSEPQAIEVICEGINAGINFIDTANVYCFDNNDIGHNERLIAKALRHSGHGSDIIIATKGGLTRPNGNWVRDAEPKKLQGALENSLKALNVDTISLYQLHAPDPNVPLEKSIETLAKLQELGKIQHIGLSNVNVAEIKRAQKITNIVSVQNRCNVNDLTSFENDVINYCEQENIAFIAYSPVGGRFGKESVANIPILQSMAEETGNSVYQLALAWLLSKSQVIIPIPGATKVKSIVSSASAAHIKLLQQQINEIDEAINFKYG